MLASTACGEEAGSGNGGGGSPRTSTPDAGCAAAAGLSGPIQDEGTASADGRVVTLDAIEFAFVATCVEHRGGETIEVTIRNTGAALHNFSVESLGIDRDVQVGESVTVAVDLPRSGAVPFVCKYHIANGMQGAFLLTG